MRLQHVLNLLELHPLLGRTTDRRGLRRVNLKPYPYFIDYRIDGDEIIVQRFRHAARRK